MSFLEEIETFKKEGNLETKVFKEKMKELIKCELKKDYDKESGSAVCYMTRIYATNEWKNKNSFVQDEDLDRVILKELYDELKNEVYVKVGYEYNLFCVSYSTIKDRTSFCDLGNYIKIDTNVSKDKSAFTIDEDIKESKIKYKTAISEYMAKAEERYETEKLKREKERREAKDKTSLSKIKNLFKIFR